MFCTKEALFTLDCWNRSHRIVSLSHILYSSWTSIHEYDWYISTTKDKNFPYPDGMLEPPKRLETIGVCCKVYFSL